MVKLLITPGAVFVQKSPSLNGLLAGLLGAVLEPTSGRTGAGCRRPCTRPNPTTRNCCSNNGRCAPSSKPWYTIVNLGRYRPDEVHVTPEGRTVEIHARHEEGSLDGTDYYVSESRRTVAIPKNVDASKVACFLNRDGRLLVQAPYLQASAEAETAKPVEISQRKEHFDARPVNVEPGTSSEAHPNEKTEDKVTAEEPKTFAEVQADSEADSKATAQDTPTTDAAETASVPEPEEAEGAEDTGLIVEEPAEEDEGPRPATPAPSEDDFTILVSPSLAEEDTIIQSQAEAEEKEQMPEIAETKAEEIRPLGDSVRVHHDDAGDTFQVKLNLRDFDADNVSVRFVDNELFIDAKRELKDNGVNTQQEVHRKYVIPETGILDAARAMINDDGLVTVSVPLRPETENTEGITIPIIQHRE